MCPIQIWRLYSIINCTDLVLSKYQCPRATSRRTMLPIWSWELHLIIINYLIIDLYSFLLTASRSYQELCRPLNIKWLRVTINCFRGSYPRCRCIQQSTPAKVQTIPSDYLDHTNTLPCQVVQTNKRAPSAHFDLLVTLPRTIQPDYSDLRESKYLLLGCQER